MAIQEVRASGLEYLALATRLLQRARLADPEAGVWEAADLQWWWRTPRRSDTIDQLFWIDDEGPVAGVVLTEWDRAWCDPIVVPSVSTVPLPTVWARAVEAIDALGLEAVETLARDDDVELLGLLAGSGFVADDERSGITWMDAQDRPSTGFGAAQRGMDGGASRHENRQPARGQRSSVGAAHIRDEARRLARESARPVRGVLRQRHRRVRDLHGSIEVGPRES